MVKEKSNKNNNNIMVGVPWNCGTDVKFLLTSLLLFCLLATTLLVPHNYRPLLSPADLYSCFSTVPSSSSSSSSSSASASSTSILPTNNSLGKESVVVPEEEEGIVVKRSFSAVGRAAYLFVQMGAYRGGRNTFAVVGLASKPLHVYSDSYFGCRWVPHNASSASAVSGTTYKMLPDWGYGRVYTVVVVNCTFPADVGSDGSGGQLVVSATTGGIDPKEEEFVALEEAPSSVNMSLYDSPPKYDYLYCGSPLFGDLSPQRVREWMAYHVGLFGGAEKSHFVIHDAGGVHPEVKEVLRPWIEMRAVTLQDVRGQERFDGYYHNQFLVVNDCLHRYRFMAKWIFFFDVDEFIYVEPSLKLDTFMDWMKGFTQFTIEQMTMSSKLCVSEDAGENQRMWGIEKLVYRDVKRGVRRDRKYAIQPRNAFSAGVHLSQNFAGKSTHKTGGKIKYFHYHGTIASRIREPPCNQFVNATQLVFQGRPYVRDDTLRKLASSVKLFEAKAIGFGRLS